MVWLDCRESKSESVYGISSSPATFLSELSIRAYIP